MTDAAQFSSAIVATVLLVAGIGKLTSRWSWLTWLAVGELVAAGLLISPLTRPIGLLAALPMTLAFVVGAFRPKASACQCFGEHLPDSSSGVRRTRNAALFGACLTAAVIWIADAAPPTMPLTATIAGLLVGGVLVAGPWAASWHPDDGAAPR